MAIYIIECSDLESMEYEADSSNKALLMFANDNGYSSYDRLILDGSTIDSFYKIDTDKIIKIIESKLDFCVQKDSYGYGVALINGQFYETWAEMVQLINMDLKEFAI